jgi:trk system potassium uptake protein TrkH
MQKGYLSERILLFSYFLTLIFVGALILFVPFFWKGEQRLSFIDALFTATSAVCVTGLITVDTPSFSLAGQVLIMALIQAGGLGIITFTTIYLTRPGQRISLSRHRVIKGYYLESVESRPVAIIRQILLFTLAIELVGAVLLHVRFHRTVSERSVFVSVFHSISAFCNAGFSLFSDNLEGYVADPLVNITVMALVVLGGLGFVVLQDIAATTLIKKKKLSEHAKIVLVVSAALIAGAAAVYLLFEFRRAYGGLPIGQKVMAAFFQAVTPRTAGFDTVSQASLSVPAKVLTLTLMFIGGSSGGTAGGVKTNTLFIILLLSLQGVDSKGEITIFRRKIGSPTISAATLITIKALALVFAALLLLTITDMWLASRGEDFTQILFEAVSAFGTVGLSLGATARLSVLGKLVVIGTMFMGRVGLLALAIPPSKPYPVQMLDYPRAEVMVG